MNMRGLVDMGVGVGVDVGVLILIVNVSHRRRACERGGGVRG